jgi:large subunit ribosomal protein MRP49
MPIYPLRLGAGNCTRQPDHALTLETRKFWREMLPRMKYRNPSIPMEVARHNDADGPSLLHIYTASKTQPSTGSTNAPTTQQSDASPPSATPNPRNTMVPETSKPTHSIDMRDQSESEILEALVEKIGAVEIKPTEQELAEMREIEEFKERSEADRVLVREKLLKERREAELLKLARGEAPVAN